MGFLCFILVYFHLSLVSCFVFKWLAPLRRARIGLLGLYHLLAILFFFLSHSILQPYTFDCG